jgi:hypothetical protein
MARLLIIGSMEGELGAAARVAIARGARLAHAEGVAAGLARLRSDGADLALVDLRHDVAWLVGALAAERIACPIVCCGPPTGRRRGGARDRGGSARLPAAAARPRPDPGHAGSRRRRARGRGPGRARPADGGAAGAARQLAARRSQLLITGESGTGKEVPGAHIHAAAAARGAPSSR